MNDFDRHASAQCKVLSEVVDRQLMGVALPTPQHLLVPMCLLFPMCHRVPSPDSGLAPLVHQPPRNLVSSSLWCLLLMARPQQGVPEWSPIALE